MLRTVEFILGLIGGILSSVAGFVILMFSFSYGNFFRIIPAGAEISDTMAVMAGVIILLTALLGLAGAIFVKRRSVMGGIFMLVSGILLLAVSGFPWSILWATELIVAGVMACVPKSAAPGTPATFGC